LCILDNNTYLIEHFRRCESSQNRPAYLRSRSTAEGRLCGYC